jgi:RimJ/RimL family protein N-acetyltransferase
MVNSGWKASTLRSPGNDKTAMPLHLESARLILRPFQDSDLESFLAYRNDPEVARYQSWNVPYPRESGVQFVDLMKMTAPASQGEWYQVAVEFKSTRELIGDVAFCALVSDGQQALIGYSLARPYWRQGYAFEAVSRLLEYLFEERDSHRVIAECDVDNIASWKLLEKLGFRREAHLVENVYFKGRYGSEYHYALLAREWRKSS